MPVYTFRCLDCRRIVQLTYSFSEYEAATPTCTHCGSENLKRRIGRVALAKSEDARMDSLMDESALAGLDEEDPKALGRFMRKMSHEMGEDLGDEFGEVVDRLERGQSPEEIEEALPELGDESGAMGGGMGDWDDF
ncbi:MAG TPA: zinc ribbon domain-containing protein [Candidatus Sulfomarinibacteraceae bacterium]|nr:zinc ribbon domain-containing protein [Candidatus Sulfomarinibacteraceae bacterium]